MILGEIPLISLTYQPLILKIVMFQLTIKHLLASQQKKQEAFEKQVEISKSNYYTTINLIDIFYHQKQYKLIGIDLARQNNTNIPHQIKFTERLKEYYGATIIIITEKQHS